MKEIKVGQIWKLNDGSGLKIKIVSLPKKDREQICAEILEVDNSVPSRYSVGKPWNWYNNYSSLMLSNVELFQVLIEGHWVLEGEPETQACPSEGYVCMGCQLYYSCVSPNQTDGKYLCYQCRS